MAGNAPKSMDMDCDRNKFPPKLLLCRDQNMTLRYLNEKQISNNRSGQLDFKRKNTVLRGLNMQQQQRVSLGIKSATAI